MATDRENMLRALRRQGWDRVPVDMDLCPSQREEFNRRYGHYNYPREFAFPHRSLWLPLEKAYGRAADLFPREAVPEGATFDEWGVGHSKGSDKALHMTRMHHPLRGDVSLEEIQAYPIPKVPAQLLPKLRAEADGMLARGWAVTGHMECTVWETAWYLRSMEDLMSDMMLGDGKAVALLDAVTDVSCERARAYVRCGVDILHLGDDIGTQRGPLMAPGMWEEWLRPRLERVIRAAKSENPDVLIFYHSCGKVDAFLEGLIAAGVEILNPIQAECMDFDAVHERVGDRIAFWGTIGTQQTLPFGSPEEVKAVVRARLERCGDRGGLVLGPTHLVEPEVPFENLLALLEAAREFAP